MNIWQSYKQEGDCLVHFARLANPRPLAHQLYYAVVGHRIFFMAPFRAPRLLLQLLPHASP